MTLNRDGPKILWKDVDDFIKEKKSTNKTVHGISASEFNKYIITIGKSLLHIPQIRWVKVENPSIYSYASKMLMSSL